MPSADGSLPEKSSVRVHITRPKIAFVHNASKNAANRLKSKVKQMKLSTGKKFYRGISHMEKSVRQRSRLLRVAVWFVVFFAALAVAGLVSEWINAASDMPNHRVVRLVVLGVANLFFIAFLASIAALFFWARLARSLPDLMGWHVQRPESEFRAVDAADGYTLDDYGEQEDRVFGELDSYIAQSWSTQSVGTYNRFNSQSVCNPANILDCNWNRTHIAKAENPIGGVLLLHGLSDSPYSLRRWDNGCMPKAIPSSGSACPDTEPIRECLPR